MWWQFWKKKHILITHDGSFHGDDLFATAALTLWIEQQGERWKLIRSRDEDIMQEADFVYDVGRIYDHDLGRYDHHQREGAGTHTNGIPYASFGLIWKHYGLDLCNNITEVWDIINRELVQPIDAADNGTDIYNLNEYQVSPFSAQDAIKLASTSEDDDTKFLDALVWGRTIIKNLIQKKEDRWKRGQELVEEFEQKFNPGDQVLVLDESNAGRRLIWEMLIPRDDTKELLYVVYNSDPEKERPWHIVAMRHSRTSFDSRKPLPEAWCGLDDEALQQASGISDAIFCHRTGFLASTKSREGAIALAQKALDA